MNKMTKIAIVCGIVFFAACNNKNSSTVQMDKEETKEHFEKMGDHRGGEKKEHGMEHDKNHDMKMDSTHAPAEMHDDAHKNEPKAGH